MSARDPAPGGRAALLADLALLGTVVVLAGVLTAALVLQIGFGEAPCPLCLLERIGMFGVCVAILLHLRQPSVRAVGLALAAALVLLVVSVRQVLLDICPRPGHAYVGSAVLGLHMPVWSVLVALGVMAGLAAVLVAFGDAVWRPPARHPGPARLARWAGLYLSALCAINLAAVAL